MTLSSSPQSPSEQPATPTITTAQLAAIRARIEPKGRWWDFELRPWHYWTAISSTTVATGAAVAVVLLAGAHR